MNLSAIKSAVPAQTVPATGWSEKDAIYPEVRKSYESDQG